MTVKNLKFSFCELTVQELPEIDYPHPDDLPEPPNISVVLKRYRLYSLSHQLFHTGRALVDFPIVISRLITSMAGLHLVSKLSQLTKFQSLKFGYYNFIFC